MKPAGEVIRVAGPLVVAKGMEGSRMYDVVRVGELRLIGEIVELQGDRASIQVYEDTTGVGPGDPVYPTFAPLTVELGSSVTYTMVCNVHYLRLSKPPTVHISKGVSTYPHLTVPESGNLPP